MVEGEDKPGSTNNWMSRFVHLRLLALIAECLQLHIYSTPGARSMSDRFVHDD